MRYFYIDGTEIDEASFNTGANIGIYDVEKRGEDLHLIKNNKHLIDELKQKLQDTDYKAIKFAEGEISEKDYKEIKEQRRQWREQINKLENQLT